MVLTAEQLSVEQLNEVYKTPQEKEMFIKYTRWFLKPRTTKAVIKMLKEFKRDIEIIKNENYIYNNVN